MSARIYAVAAVGDGKVTMVKATSQAQAVRHIARHQYRVSIASALDVADYMQDGWKIADATAEPQPELIDEVSK